MFALLLMASALGATRPADPSVTASVKVALAPLDSEPGNRILVDVDDGDLTIHGRVTSDAQRREAARVASEQSGVERIHNRLQVVAREAKSKKRNDAAIAVQVERVLATERALTDSSIEVESVENGVVTLSGQANSLLDHLLALTHASSIRDVARVESNIQAPGELSEVEVEAVAVPSGTRSRALGRVADDLRISEAVEQRFLELRSVDPRSIDIDTESGVVSLFGTVGSSAQRTLAEKAARQVQGVEAVENDLRVVPSSVEPDVRANDSEIQAAARRALSRNPALNRVEVDVSDGIARLEGTVPSHWDRMRAAALVRAVPGALAVENDLRIARVDPKR